MSRASPVQFWLRMYEAAAHWRFLDTLGEVPILRPVSIVKMLRIFSMSLGSMLLTGCTPDQPKPNSPPAPVAQAQHENATTQPVTLATDASSPSSKDEVVA